VGDVTELLARIKKGDAQAQDELYRLVQPELRKLALHPINTWRAGRRARTTDVIDRAFMKLMRKLMQVPSPGWQHRGVFYDYAKRNIKHLVMDEIGLRSPKFDLQLMSWGDGTGVPTSGNNLVVIGIDDNDLLHIRIFDQGGHRVTDTDEVSLPRAQDQAILFLRQRLSGLLPPHVMTNGEKAQTLREVTSIVGETRPRPDPRRPVDPLTETRLRTLKAALVDLGQALSEDHRLVVERRFLEGYTLDEVAEQLSINRDKVFKMSKVALAYLRERLGPSFME
jgi:RNA polymerase sigma factor (sigma-70 family)